VSYVSRSMIIAENETLKALVTALSCLVEGAKTMSRYQYLAQLTEIATEIAEVRKVSADEVFKTLTMVPHDKVPEMVKKLMA
jgi:hypothetical protein